MLVVFLEHRALMCLQSFKLHGDQGRSVHVDRASRVSPVNTLKNETLKVFCLSFVV
jgi:hypothetical protein